MGDAFELARCVHDTLTSTEMPEIDPKSDPKSHALGRHCRRRRRQPSPPSGRQRCGWRIPRHGRFCPLRVHLVHLVLGHGASPPAAVRERRPHRPPKSSACSVGDAHQAWRVGFKRQNPPPNGQFVLVRTPPTTDGDDGRSQRRPPRAVARSARVHE